MAKMEIYTVDELMDINDSLMDYLGDEQGHKVVANLMAAGDRCKEVIEALENRGDGIREALAAAHIDIDEAQWVQFIASWIASYIIEYEEPTAIENEAWN